MEYYCSGLGRSNIEVNIFEEPPGLEMCFISEFFDPSQDAWIKTIYVDPRDRGQGYGSKMLTNFVNECYANGVRRIMGALIPSTDSDEEYVVAWYQSHGFVIIEPKASLKYIYMPLKY